MIAKSNWGGAGFMVIDNGNAQIGISRNSKIFKHIVGVEGSASRDQKLYFIETVFPETLHGFADALVELGFTDAIYITGGSQPDLFYRTSDGTAYGQYIDHKTHYLIVWTR